MLFPFRHPVFYRHRFDAHSDGRSTFAIAERNNGNPDAVPTVQTQYPAFHCTMVQATEKADDPLQHRPFNCALTGFSVLTVAVSCLPWLGKNYEARFIEPWQVAVLGLGCLASHIATVQGYYVLARRANPLLAASLIGSIATSAAVWMGGYYYSTDGVVIGYAAAMCLVLAPVHTYAYARFRRESGTQG